jgi:DNA-binding response OmpR family regulator
MTRSVAIVVEDDEEISAILCSLLGRIGMEPIAARTGSEGVEAARDNAPTLVTIDVGLPGMDGFEVARRIRAFSSCYIIMVSARGDEIDVLEGLGAGADDYIVKPLRARELRARIDAMRRRPREGGPPPVQKAIAAPASVPCEPAREQITAYRSISSTTRQESAPEAETPLRHGALILDMHYRMVELNGNPVDLTRYEFDLLTELMEAGRRVCSKSALALALRGSGRGDPMDGYVSDADLRTIDTHIANLRKKLGDNYREPRVIETVRGIGYRMALAS